MSDPKSRTDRVLPREEQQALAPDDVVALLYAGNARFVAGDVTQHCGAVKGAIDRVELGNLTALLRALAPAIDEVSGHEPRTTENPVFIHAVAEQNVRRTLRRIRAESEVLRELETQGAVRIVGGVYDMDTGEVTPIH